MSQKKQDLAKALKSLGSILQEDYSIIVRDASIQRFEYTVEVFWKFLKEYMLSNEGIDCYSPKSCIREYHATGQLTDAETEVLLKMIDDRNLTSHTYHEEVSAKIYENLPEYYAIMQRILGEASDRRISPQ